MKVVILCGGLGTRMREETEFRPKPLVHIGPRPVLWHIMKNYAHFNHRHFVLCLGYRGDMIKEYFLNYEAMSSDFTIRLGDRTGITHHGTHTEQDFDVTLADTGQNTMTGGRIKRIQRYIDNETFLCTYGDGLADVDIGELVAFHKNHGRIATLTTMKPRSRFGILKLDGAGRVEHFHEKPVLDDWVNAGFFVFNRQVFDYLGDDDCILEREPLEQLAGDDQLMAFRHEGCFYTMDTYREYKALNEMWESGQVPWKVWE